MPLLRLYLDVSNLAVQQFSQILPLLPSSTHGSIQRYHFPSDRNLSLGSALLQRLLICTHYRGYPTLSSVPILREKDSGRPYHAVTGNGQCVEDYNVSHHNPRLDCGEGNERCLVVLAAIVSPTPGRRRRVGVDIVPTSYRRPGAEGFVDTFCGEDHAGVFTAYERGVVMAHEDKVRWLYLLWALKEAYTKAVGVGVVMDLTRVEFRGLEEFTGERRWRGAEVWVDGKREEKWYLEVSFLPGRMGGENEGFFVAVCCERDAMAEGDEDGEWREVDLVREIVEPWGGGAAE
jgi:phosphopantetheinyl transferase